MMTSVIAPADIDKARAALDVVRAAGSVSDDASVATLRQLEGGWSRHSYVLEIVEPGRGEHHLIVRVRPAGAILDTDLTQEYRTYALLMDEPVPTPVVHGLDESDDNPFGGPFFVMDRLPGSDLNVWRGHDRETLAADWAAGRGIATDLVDNLAAIHAVDAARLRGAVVARDFAETLAFWHEVQTRVGLVRDPIVEEAYRWAAAHRPDDVPARLVHGDYRVGNCLVHDGRISGILDWELSFVGDPRFDLGYMSLAYHAGKFVKPGSELLNAVGEHDWMYDRYAQLTGAPVDREVVRTFAVVGALMLIAILHTGVRVYATGQTDDIRMAWSRFAIPGLRQDLSRLMGWHER
jgi:aminoglycoside phosphotransferase (APT) family kinase protein